MYTIRIFLTLEYCQTLLTKNLFMIADTLIGPICVWGRISSYHIISYHNSGSPDTYLYVYVSSKVFVCECLCVCVCVREREREGVCVCVWCVAGRLVAGNGRECVC